MASQQLPAPDTAEYTIHGVKLDEKYDVLPLPLRDHLEESIKNALWLPPKRERDNAPYVYPKVRNGYTIQGVTLEAKLYGIIPRTLLGHIEEWTRDTLVLPGDGGPVPNPDTKAYAIYSSISFGEDHSKRVPIRKFSAPTSLPYANLELLEYFFKTVFKEGMTFERHDSLLDGFNIKSEDSASGQVNISGKVGWHFNSHGGLSFDTGYGKRMEWEDAFYSSLEVRSAKPDEEILSELFDLDKYPR